MFQLVCDVVIAGLIIWGFLQAIFWVKNKVTGEAPAEQPEPCCKGKCKSDVVAPEGESENKKEGPTDAA